MGAPFITGQVILRNQGEKEGRTLFALVGLIAVPKGQEYLDGHQYTVLAFNNTQWTLDTTAPIDRRAETHGHGLGTVVTLPLWRV
jgi:hypothetical protein